MRSEGIWREGSRIMLARVAHLMFTSSNRLAFSRCCRMRRRGGRCLCLHLQSPIMPAPGWAAVGGAGPVWRPCVASSTSPSCPPPTSPTTHTRRTASTRYHTHTRRRSGKALGMDHRKALSSSQGVHHHPLTGPSSRSWLVACWSWCAAAGALGAGGPADQHHHAPGHRRPSVPWPRA